MTGLLSANRIAVFKHVLEHIAVAYLCGFALDAVVFAKLEETHIAHHRDHGGILGELATPLHIERTDRNDLITVNKPALFIDHQQTVCVAIKGKADITALFHGIGLELLQVCRAAAVVNIHAIRLRADDVAFRAEGGEQLLGRNAGRPVCTVKRYLHPIKTQICCGNDMADIVGERILCAGDLADFPAHLDGGNARFIEDDRFDLLLERVRQLVAIRFENFNAIIFARVVAGRDHHARIVAIFRDEIGDRRRGDNAHEQHVGAHRAKARRESRF